MYMWINVSFRKGSTATTTRRKKCSFNAKYGSFLMKNTERNETKIELLKYFNPLSIRPSDFKLSWYWYSSDHLMLNVPFSRTDVFKNNILFLFGSVICGTIYLLV